MGSGAAEPARGVSFAALLALADTLSAQGELVCGICTRGEAPIERHPWRDTEAIVYPNSDADCVVLTDGTRIAP